MISIYLFFNCSDRGKPETAPNEHENGGCMEMVIVRASSGCHIHDKRLHLGI